jgi:hypothetical protein
MLITVIPVLFAVAGVLFWALASNEILKKAGMITFACGMLALALVLAKVTWRVGAVAVDVPTARA